MSKSVDDLNSRGNKNSEVSFDRNSLNLFIHYTHIPFLILDQDLRIVEANNSFYQFFSVEKKATSGMHFLEIAEGMDIPELKQELELIIPKKQKLKNFEVETTAGSSSKRHVLLNAEEIPQKKIGESLILLSIEDVTDKRKTGQALKESEHRYKELLQSSTSLSAILEGEDLIIKLANKPIIEIWGKGPDVIGNPLMDVLPEMKEQGMPEIFHEVYTTGEAFYAHQMPLIHEKNGEKVLGYFDFVYQPQRNIRGDIVEISVVANDVSKQAKLNQELKESEEKFRQMVDFMPHKISIADASGKTFYFNNSWTEYTGFSMEQLMQVPRENRFHPDEKERIMNSVISCLSSGKKLELEMRIPDKNGNYKWHLTRGIPIKDGSGKIVSWISSSTEIQKLKEEEQRKEEFLKMVSHELKTPVTSIKGYAQLLLSMLEKNKESRLDALPLPSFLKRIDNQIDRLIRLISEILDLSRIEENELELRKESFNINDLVEETVQDIHQSNREIQPLKVIHHCNCNISADRDRIGQVIINFITNAIKYSTGNKNIDVIIDKTEEDMVCVTVKDRGIGIEKKELKKIFQRFYRVEKKNEDTYSGFGIGLYLSQEIIKRHQGRIKVKSQPGEGSEFIFELPCIK